MWVKLEFLGAMDGCNPKPVSFLKSVLYDEQICTMNGRQESTKCLWSRHSVQRQLPHSGERQELHRA